MTMSTRACAPLFACMAALALAACATPKVAPTGFLVAHDTLQASDETGAVRILTADMAVLAGYGSVVIDAPSVTEARLSEKELAAIQGALTEALAAELARERKVVALSGAGVLRVRYNIVRVDTSNVALNALTSTVIGAVDYGSLALEVEVVDSVTGARVAAMTWARGAKATNVLGAYTPTGNARALAPDFAKRLARLISPTMPG